MAAALADHGLGGLTDRPRVGKKPTQLRHGHERAFWAFLMPTTASGLCTRWTGPLLAKARVNATLMFSINIWRFLREHNIDLVARKSWCESNDPEFVAKAADVVGLCVDPPCQSDCSLCRRKASLDPKSFLGVSRRGYLKLPNGRALTGQSHD